MENFTWLKDALSKEFPTAKVIIQLFERYTSSYYLGDLGAHSMIKQVGVALKMSDKLHGARFPIETLDIDGLPQPINFNDPEQRNSMIHNCLVIFAPIKHRRPPRPIY